MDAFSTIETLRRFETGNTRTSKGPNIETPVVLYHPVVEHRDERSVGDEYPFIIGVHDVEARHGYVREAGVVQPIDVDAICQASSIDRGVVAVVANQVERLADDYIFFIGSSSYFHCVCRSRSIHRVLDLGVTAARSPGIDAQGCSRGLANQQS